MAGIKHIDVGTQLTKAEWEAASTHEMTSGTAFPDIPTEKDLFYRTDQHKWYIYNGSAWVLLNKRYLDDMEDVDASSPTNTDIIRFNSGTGKWEAKPEPFSFTQLNLTPRSSAVEDVEGGMWYNAEDDHIYVGTEV